MNINILWKVGNYYMNNFLKIYKYKLKYIFIYF